MLSELYVFIYLRPDGWVPCGLLEFEEKGRFSSSTFRYGQKYLERQNAIAIDPVQLPLTERTQGSPADFPVFNGIRDAGPDKWGRYLLDKKFMRSLSEVEYIAASGVDHAGALGFGIHLDTRPQLYTPKGFIPAVTKRLDLAVCAGAVEDAIAEEETDRLREYLSYGPSLGGARPKATVDWNGKAYIAKFSLALDRRNEPLIEYATMKLAQRCGLNVPSIDKTVVQERTVYLIERFDRDIDSAPIPFVSGLTLTGLHESDYARWSYPLLVDAIGKYSDDPLRDTKELFRRMIFNIFVYNNDDHLRNFGFISAGRDRWALSPLYDVIPATVHSQTYTLAMGIGLEGKKASLSNAISCCERFHLTQETAKREIEKLQVIVKGWKHHFHQCGVSEPEIRMLENSFALKP